MFNELFNILVGAGGFWRLYVLGNYFGGTRPLYLKRVSQSIATSLIRSYRQTGDRTDKQAIEPTNRRSNR